MKTEAKKSPKITRQQWLSFALSLVAIASTGLMYFLKQSQIDYLNQTNFDLQTQIISLEAKNSSQSTTYISAKNTSINVYTPTKNSQVSSPLEIAGKIPGNWSFEASFPIELVDKNGAILAKTTGKVAGDWMSDNQVLFTASLSWQNSYTGAAKLILKNDNPSGLADKADFIEIPLTVK